MKTILFRPVLITALAVATAAALIWTVGPVVPRGNTKDAAMSTRSQPSLAEFATWDAAEKDTLFRSFAGVW